MPASIQRSRQPSMTSAVMAMIATWRSRPSRRRIAVAASYPFISGIPREAWFTVDLRSLDSARQDCLETAVVSTARRIAEQEGVGFRMERKMGIDY